MEPHEFTGTIGDWWWESTAAWPPFVRARAGSPNVLVVLLDDVGFAQLGCFGSDLSTPTLDRLADGGLRYTNFHTTALCSPTRATVLTGRNHHNTGVGRIIELACGYPGYDCRIPDSTAMLPAMLTPHGYAAWAVGKWHLTPDDEAHLAGPRDRWPVGRGFETFYGFFPGETHQNAPALVRDNQLTRPPRSVEDGYHLTEDLADHLIGQITDLRHVDPDKPFFAYFATGACHSPHQAPPEWIERYRGRFDRGWDVWRAETFERQRAAGIVAEHTVLSERPDWVPAWESLTDDERHVYARFMEAFAGFLSHTDHQLGRIVDHLEATGDLDDTIILALSDNGASSEGGPIGSLNDVRTWNAAPQSTDEALARIDEIGGPRIHNNYPWGWTVAGNTPFRRWKRETHEGGVADPLIVHWPAGISDEHRGGLRRHYVHSIDLAPTLLDVIGVEPPDSWRGTPQRPVDGVSFASTLGDPDADEVHTTQYYEMFGCRAIYHEGFKAVVYHDIQFDEPGLDKVPWELYDLRADPSETDDLAASMPDKVAELDALWWAEARRNQVLPVDNRPFADIVFDRPSPLPARNHHVYRPDRPPVVEHVAVNVKNRPHAVTAHLVVEGEAEGFVVGQGSVLGGWSLYVQDGELRYCQNQSGATQVRVTAGIVLGAGTHTVGYRYEGGMAGSTEPGAEAPDDGTDRSRLLELVVDGEVVGSATIAGFTWNRFSLTGAGLTVGYGLAPAVSDDHVAPFTFTGGSIDHVVIEAVGKPMTDPLAEAMDAIASQ